MVDRAGMAWSDIAASAYRAYAASVGNKNFRGDPMPRFVDLPRPIRVAWEAAVRHVGNLIQINPCNVTEIQVAEMETKWTGWNPP